MLSSEPDTQGIIDTRLTVNNPYLDINNRNKPDAL